MPAKDAVSRTKKPQLSKNEPNKPAISIGCKSGTGAERECVTYGERECVCVGTSVLVGRRVVDAAVDRMTNQYIPDSGTKWGCLLLTLRKAGGDRCRVESVSRS